MAKISEIMQNFIMSSPKRAIWFMKTMKAGFWEKKGQKMALEVFHQATEKVPAYQDFLKKQGVDPSAIKTLEDFQEKVPLMTKKNYLSQYSLAELSQEEIKKETFGMCFTSGTTSVPLGMLIYKKSFPLALRGFINYLHYLWDIYSPSKSILFMNGLALGPWLAGFFVNLIVAKEVEKHNFTLVTPGSDPTMMVEILEKIGRNYEEIIIICYSSVLRAFFEEGEKRKINWKEFNIKILTGGEVFPSTFRETFFSKIDPSLKKNPWRIVEIFATSDASILGYETPLTILIKELLNKRKELCLKIFDKEKIENLFQYNSLSVFLEEKGEKVCVTKPGVIPLIRYQIGDLGKMISFETMKEILAKEGYNIDDLLKKASWQKGYFKWPFFAFLGRGDDMIAIYSGAKIYSQNLFSLLEKPEAKEIKSFKISTQVDENQNKRFVVYLELKSDLKFSQEESIKSEQKYQKLIHEQLLKTNIDYKDAYRLNPKIVLPIVKIFPFSGGLFKEDKNRQKPKLVI